jgi:cell division protein FtsW
MYTKQKKLQSDLHIFLGIIATLITIGLVFIYSASSIYALEKLGSSHYFVKKQLIGLIIGLVGMMIFRIIPLSYIKKSSPFLFIGSLFLTACTLVSPFGLKIHGSSRWVALGSFSLQPSELLKIFFILYMAYFLSKKNRVLSSFLHGYLPFILITGIVCLLLLKQPDFGMAITIALTAFFMFFIVHFSAPRFIGTCALIIPLFIGLIYWYPYRLRRIMTFLNPWSDPQGAGFQIIQSLIAIGSGSFWGLGVSHSKQKFFYLPMLHTDFIFSIIAEETGFFGASLLIFLYVLFLYFGMRIAWQLQDQWCVLLTLGFVILISLQAIINLAVTTGLFPTKGIGLPFVSYGNSALVASLCFVGLIINCVYENKSVFAQHQ